MGLRRGAGGWGVIKVQTDNRARYSGGLACLFQPLGVGQGLGGLETRLVEHVEDDCTLEGVLQVVFWGVEGELLGEAEVSTSASAGQGQPVYGLDRKQ